MGKKSGTSIHTKIYSRFKGVDFSTDPALVADTRSPWAVNLIPDSGGMPEKRPGWRTLKTFDDQINGLYSGVFSGDRHLLVHTGTSLYRFYEDETESVLLSSSFPNQRSRAVYLGERLWIFTGAGLYVYDGSTCALASASAYIPLTKIGAAPAGGGTTYEAVNLIGNKQKMGFLADGSSREYVLPYKPIEAVTEVTVNGQVKTVTTDYTVDLTNGKVTFNTAPSAPLVGGEDNVFITFQKTISGYADKINHCRNAIAWGIGGASDRLVCCGDPDFQNRDYISEYNNPYYWPDLNYSSLGTDETAILGYRRIGETLAVIKEDNGQDSTVFIRSGSINDDGDTVFSVKPCLSGMGAAGFDSFGNIADDQLVLTDKGVFAITTNNLTNEKITQSRSGRINPKLTTENLDEAVVINFDERILIFINGQVFGLDGKQEKSYLSSNAQEYFYEAFYWDNVPARVVMKIKESGDELLYFGTEGGAVCKINTDIAGLQKYADDDQPISSVWATKSDDDGDPMLYKTLLKKGNAVTIKPYTRSSAEVCFRTDKDAMEWHAASGIMDIFSFDEIDFSRITFNSNEAPQEVVFNRKVKNYKRLQIVVKNNVLYEGFGVYEITKHYVVGNYAKR